MSSNKAIEHGYLRNIDVIILYFLRVFCGKNTHKSLYLHRIGVILADVMTI